jgi:hypothetical protein
MKRVTKLRKALNRLLIIGRKLDIEANYSDEFNRFQGYLIDSSDDEAEEVEDIMSIG